MGAITMKGGFLENSAAGMTSTISTGASGSANSIVLTATSTVGGAGNLTVTSLITDSSLGYGLIKTGAGTFTTNTPNTYLGPTTINGGVFSVSLIANGGQASGIGQSNNGVGNLVITGGGYLQYTGSGANTDRLFTLGPGGGGIDSSGVGALNLLGNTLGVANAVAFSGTNTSPTLTLTGVYTGSANTFAPIIGNNGSGSTSVTMNGEGTWILSGQNTYSGATTISASPVSITTAGTLQAGVATSAFGIGSPVTIANVAGATLALNGYNETIGSLSGGGDTGGVVSLGSGTLTVGAIPTANTTFAGSISGGGGLTVEGGALSLTADITNPNTYTGPTSVANGTLYVDGYHGTSGSPIANAYTIGASGVLAGNGSIYLAATTDGMTTNPGVTIGSGGMIIPGYNPNNHASPAVAALNVNATSGVNTAVAMATGSTFEAYLTSSTAVTNFASPNTNLPPADYLNVGVGVVTLGTGVTLDLVTDASVRSGDSFTIIDPTSLTGVFSTVNLSGAATGLVPTVLYGQGPSGADVVVTLTTLVPEPSSWALAAMAGLGGLVLRRRAKKAGAHRPATPDPATS